MADEGASVAINGLQNQETIDEVAKLIDDRGGKALPILADVSDPEQVGRMVEKIANTPPAPGHDRVMYAGLPEHEETVLRKEKGIPYHREVVEWFNNMSPELELGISFP